jgi:hypothetical protein
VDAKILAVYLYEKIDYFVAFCGACPLFALTGRIAEAINNCGKAHSV